MAKVNVDLCVSIAQMFPPVVQALAASKLAQYMIQLPQEKPSSEWVWLVGVSLYKVGGVVA